jgi:hypothetical protein
MNLKFIWDIHESSIHIPLTSTLHQPAGLEALDLPTVNRCHHNPWPPCLGEISIFFPLLSLWFPYGFPWILVIFCSKNGDDLFFVVFFSE